MAAGFSSGRLQIWDHATGIVHVDLPGPPAPVPVTTLVVSGMDCEASALPDLTSHMLLAGWADGAALAIPLLACVPTLAAQRNAMAST